MITIGLDSHPDSHTVAALDENGSTLASLTIANNAEGLVQLHLFALPFSERCWAIEGAAKRFFCRLTDEQELLEQIVTDGHSNNETALAELKRVHAP